MIFAVAPNFGQMSAQRRIRANLSHARRTTTEADRTDRPVVAADRDDRNRRVEANVTPADRAIEVIRNDGWWD